MECQKCKCSLDGQGFRCWPGDTSNPGGAYCFGCAPADNAKAHVPIEMELIDPCERAYDEGLEANANDLPRQDNPYSNDDLRIAWDDGWLCGRDS